MNSRTIASNYIKDKNARILELGPLNRSLLDRKKYKNYFFADIHSTEEVKDLYSGSNYLKRTGIVVDLEDIIPIDYVVKDTYKETFKDLEKFDYVIASHVLEHMPNLLNFFFDVQNILTEDGELIIIYPDKRFCFDHFRSESKFADIYDIWKTSEVGNPRQTLDFFTNVLHENNAVKFWDMDEEIPMYNGEDVKNNLQRYPMWKKGMLEKDVHYWPFSDYGFLKFLRDCMMYSIFDFSITKFVPTQKDTQEFLVIMNFSKRDNLEEIDKKLQSAKRYYENVYYRLDEYKELTNQLQGTITMLNDKIVQSEIKNEELLKDIKKKEQELKRLESNLEKTQSDLFAKETELVEKTKVKNMIKAIVRESCQFIKKPILLVKNKIIKRNKNEDENSKRV